MKAKTPKIERKRRANDGTKEIKTSLKTSFPYLKVTPAEQARRQAAVVRLWRAGYSYQAISKALGIGTMTVSRDLKRTNTVPPGPVRRPYWQIRTDDPPSFDWRTDERPMLLPRIPDPRPADPAYRRSAVINDAVHWIEGFSGGDHPNRFAHNLKEAEAHGDTAWLAYARELIETAHRQTGQLLRVLNDPEYGDRCRRGTDLDVRTRSGDVPRLHIVS